MTNEETIERIRKGILELIKGAEVNGARVAQGMISQAITRQFLSMEKTFNGPHTVNKYHEWMLNGIDQLMCLMEDAIKNNSHDQESDSHQPTLFTKEEINLCSPTSLK